MLYTRQIVKTPFTRREIRCPSQSRNTLVESLVKWHVNLDADCGRLHMVALTFC